MNQDFSIQPHNYDSAVLFGLSLSNFGLMYFAHIYLATHLTLDAFEDYSVAISLVNILSTVATLGLEKSALRLVALYIERENWPRLRGYWLFSLRAIFLFSIVLMGFVSAGLTTWLTWLAIDFHIGLIIYTGFLPIIALCLFALEVATVYGRQVWALFLYRFLLPASYLLMLFAVGNSPLTLNDNTALICLGSAWSLTLCLLGATIRSARPVAAWPAKADTARRFGWLKRSLPLLLSSLLMTVLVSAGTLILKILHPSEAMVGTYAVAIQTSSLIGLIGTSTNRYYLPMLVVLMERQRYAEALALLGKRMRLIACLSVIFFGIVVLYGPSILHLFGAKFDFGYPTLLVCAAGAVFHSLFSDAPYYLQFMGMNRLVLGLMGTGAIMLIVLASWLGSRYGMLGVAVSYAGSTVLVFVGLKVVASRHLRSLVRLNAR